MWATNSWRNFTLAFSNFAANRRQNILSISAVILGSLAIAAVFTVNQNVNVYVDSLIAKSGGPNLFIYSKSMDASFEPQDISTLKALPSTRYVVADAQFNGSVIFDSKSHPAKIVRYDLEYEKARPIKIIQGQFLSQADALLPSHSVVLSDQAAKMLSDKLIVGKEVLINFRDRNLVAFVLGIAKAEFDPEDRGTVWVSKSLFRELMQSDAISAVILGNSQYSMLDDYESRVLASQSAKFKDRLDSYNPRKNFEQLRGEYETFINTGMVIGFLALLGGAVSVMNLMLMNVRLRTKEIGLYRALGFSTKVVLEIFIFESMITLNLGGILGAVAGCLFGYLISSSIVTTVPFISFSAFLLSFTSSAVTGLIFSYVPALRASKMDTVEALRS